MGSPEGREHRTYTYEGDIIVAWRPQPDGQDGVDEVALDYCSGEDPALWRFQETLFLLSLVARASLENGLKIDSFGHPFASSEDVGLEGHDRLSGAQAGSEKFRALSFWPSAWAGISCYFSTPFSAAHTGGRWERNGAGADRSISDHLLCPRWQTWAGWVPRHWAPGTEH